MCLGNFLLMTLVWLGNYGNEIFIMKSSRRIILFFFQYPEARKMEYNTVTLI